MPLTSKGEEILANMKKQYGSERGERVFYASKNKGTISGVDAEEQKEEKWELRMEGRDGKQFFITVSGANQKEAIRKSRDHPGRFVGVVGRVYKDAEFSSAGARRMRFGDVRIEEKGDKFVVQGKEYGSYEEAKRAAQAARSDADPPIPADYGSKLDAVERAMVRLGSRMDALQARRDADDTPAERHGVVIGGKREMPR